MKKVFNLNFNMAVVAGLAAVAPAYSKPASVNPSKLRPVATAVPSQYVAASASAVSGEAMNANASEEAASSDASASQRWPLPVTVNRAVTSLKKVQETKSTPAKTTVAKAFPAKNAVPAQPVVVSSLIKTPTASAVSTTVVTPAVNVSVGASSTRAASKISETARVTNAVAPARTETVALLPPRSAESVGELKAVIAPSEKTVTKVVTTKTVKTVKVAPTVKIARREPTNLSSRAKDRMVLARLEADLRRAQGRLNNANATLGQGQQQLMRISGILQKAMLESSGEDAKGLHPFVRVAQRYAGTPYVWGGESRNGFDCSGFIIVVMRDLGYKALPHSAAEQFNYGTPIAKPLLKAGDIVFFKNTYKPGVSHVGIYIGRGRFIHAAGTGTGTIVSGLSEPKWIKHYAGARRLVRH